VIAYILFSLLASPVPFLYCLLFGALISPTDPIAVLGILKSARIPASLELKIAGESLFNDGVAVVLFMTLAELAAAPAADFAIGSALQLFAREAGGGLLYGAALGWLGYISLRSIDHYQVEVLITLALVMGGYFLADLLHVSGPLAMVVAGLITGSKGTSEAMSDVTRDYVSKFWELIDELLNAILFLLIGLEMLVIPMRTPILYTGLVLIPALLLARWLSVGISVLTIRRWVFFEKHTLTILTWGGLRGGISVAMALFLPAHYFRDQLVAVTYVVVIFSILVQGLSIGPLAKRLYRS
jgi:CPA1 family monovalent cation:H+ antiporter